MRSPFPGMDPYLEAWTGDVHASFMVYTSDALQPQLPRDLIARIDFDDEDLLRGETPNRFVKIIDASREESLVSIIDYVRPVRPRVGRRKVAASPSVSLVEIDLYAAGLAPELGATSRYAACVMRAAARNAEHHFFDLRGRLPAIRIPLRAGDEDAVLDLQALVDMSYRNGYYADTDYKKPPVPPLSPDDEAWAHELLKAAGKR